MHSIEDGIVFSLSKSWNPAALTFFVLIYIGVYPFTLWFTPFYAIVNNNKKALKTLSYGLALIYAIVLPFYLFFPVSNVYTYFSLNSSLESILPGVNHFFYSTTTTNNCFPSLHVAVALLIARSAKFTENKKYIYFTSFIAIAVIISVMYLVIHWITDVIFGIIISSVVFMVISHVIKDD